MAQRRSDQASNPGEPLAGRPPTPGANGATPDDELLGGDVGRGLARRVVAGELGEEWATRFGAVWQRFDEWNQRAVAGEGLRERKKRETRQRMSDVATALFLARGYDNVKISEIAETVGVSEKTIYNYFPTKESLVYDQADEQLLSLATAVRDRPQGSSPTAAVVAALKADAARFNTALWGAHPDGMRLEFLMAFGEMIRNTPALRAAWGEHRHRLVEAFTVILADEAGIDPRDPEPTTAARSMASLVELLYDSILRHIADGITAHDLQPAIEADLDRAGRLLDTGLWSFHLMVEGRKTKDQLRDAALAAEHARQQVLSALRDAKRAFDEIREQTKAAGRELREETRAADKRHREERKEEQRKHLEQAQAAGRQMRGRGRS